MKALYLALLSCLLLPAARAQESKSTYYIGHSLINLNIPAMVHSLALDAGYADDTYAYQIGNGANLWYQWDTLTGNEQGIPFQQALLTGAYENLILTEAVPLKGHLQWSNTYRFADSLCDFGHQYRPDIRSYIYETWHCINSGNATGCEWDPDDHIAWRDRLSLDRPLWESIRDSLAGWHPGREYYMIPGGQGLARLYDAIEAGTVPGINAIGEFFNDDIHLKDWGNYYIACIMFACIYGETPEGLTGQTYSEWGQPFAQVPAALAARLQSLAMETVCEEDYKHFACLPNAVAENEVLGGIHYKPGIGALYWEQAFSGTYQLSDVQGRVLQRGSLQDARSLGIDQHLSGIYYLQVRDLQGHRGQKTFYVAP